MDNELKNKSQYYGLINSFEPNVNGINVAAKIKRLSLADGEAVNAFTVDAYDVDWSGYELKQYVDVNYTEAEVNEENTKHLVADASGNEPGTEGYVKTYEEGYTELTTNDTHSEYSTKQIHWSGEVLEAVNKITDALVENGIIKSDTEEDDNVIKALITSEIAKLDADVNSGEDSELFVVGVTETDGKITAVTVDDSKLAETLSGLQTSLDELTTTITTLVGEDTDKSVRDIAASEVAKIVANADESYDTLKEIADWIVNDTTGAAAMANDISALKTTVGDSSNGLVKDVADNTNAISDLETLVGTLPSDTEKTNIVDYVKELVDSSSSELDDAIDELTGDVEALQNVIGDSSNGLVKDVADNTNSISDLETLVGTLPEDADVDSVVEYVESLVNTKANQTDVDSINDILGHSAEYYTEAEAEAYNEEHKDEDGFVPVNAGDIKTAGEGLINDVDDIINKLGTKGTEDTASTGIYKEIEDAIAGITLTGSDYIDTTDNTISAIVSELGDIALELGTDGKYTYTEASDDLTGLVLASDVASIITNDEAIIASALNLHEENISYIASVMQDWDYWESINPQA